MSNFHRIEEFRPEFTQQVIELIVSIQHDEFGVAITAEEQPDLGSIPEFYQLGSGNFWLAVRDGRVLGTVALKDIGNGDVALRKMFVAPEARGKEAGVAKSLLDTLLGWAEEKEVRRIFLGTTAAFKAAHRFYEKNRFAEIRPEDLPESFPRMIQDTKYYRRVLRAAGGLKREYERSSSLKQSV